MRPKLQFCMQFNTKYNFQFVAEKTHHNTLKTSPCSCLKHGGGSTSMWECFCSTSRKSWWGRWVDLNTKRPTASCKRREAGVVVHHSLGQWTQAHNEICKGRASDQSRINLLEWLSQSPILKTNECLWQDFKITFQLLSILSDWASAILFQRTGSHVSLLVWKAGRVIPQKTFFSARWL